MNRKFRFHIHNSLLVLLVLGIVVMINFISHRHYKLFDFTKNKSHTLSSQSVKIVKGLKTKIKIIGFFEKKKKQVFYDLVDKYMYYTDQIEKELVDPEVAVRLAEKHGIRQMDVVVVEGPKKTLKVEDLTEENLTNALVKVTQEKNKNFYFVTGHLEKSITDKERSGYSHLKKELEESGYSAKELFLMKELKIPEDCDALVIAGPQKSFLDKEGDVIQEYAQKGGQLFVFLDPNVEVPLSKLLSDLGVIVHNDIILDKESRILGGDFVIPLIYTYGEHEVLKDFGKQKVATFFPLARSFEQKDKLPEGVSFEFLAKTSPASWGETDSKAKEVSFDPKKDIQGPLTVAAVMTKGKTRLILFGSSHIATNTFLFKSGNRDLVLNAFSWLAKDTDLISVRPKKEGVSTMTLTPAQGKLVAGVTVVAIPLFIILFGVFYWNKRRKK